MTGFRIISAPLAAALVLLAACSSSGKTGTPSTSTQPASRSLSQIALVRSATDDLFHACAQREVAGVQHHVAPKLRHEDWKDACGAAAAHHMRLATAAVVVHGNTATARVRLTTDHGHVAGALRWHHDHDGWRLTDIPSVLTGSWDHDGHHWLSTSGPDHHDEPDH